MNRKNATVNGIVASRSDQFNAFVRPPATMGPLRYALSAMVAAVCVQAPPQLLAADPGSAPPPLSEGVISIEGFEDYITFSGNLDLGYQKSQFAAPNQNAVLGDWDTRIEFWLSPFRTNFSWGAYLRFAGVDSSKNPATTWYDNALLAAPGAGLQLFPFSLPDLREPGNLIGDLLGPLRVFGEYNRVDYWGSANTWRPTEQIRAGMDYWRARNVNAPSKMLWSEIWTGLYYQSSNDFSDHYNSLVFANSARLGARLPGRGITSWISPYLAMESSYTGHPGYYWENRFLVGGGLRFAPPIPQFPEGKHWINRAVIFAEYLNAPAYYYNTPTTRVPHYDIQVGVSLSLGAWYR